MPPVCGGDKLFILLILDVLALILVTLGWVGDRMRLPTSLEAPAKGPLKGVGLSGDRQRTAHPGAVSQRLDRRC